MNRSKKHPTFELIIAIMLSLGCGFLLFGGACWNTEHDTGKYMMISGIISAPIITLILHKRLKPKNDINKKSRILWNGLTFLPLFFLGLFLQTAVGLYFFFKYFLPMDWINDFVILQAVLRRPINIEP